MDPIGMNVGVSMIRENELFWGNIWGIFVPNCWAISQKSIKHTNLFLEIFLTVNWLVLFLEQNDFASDGEKFQIRKSLGIQSPSENGFMEPKYYAFRRWWRTSLAHHLRIWRLIPRECITQFATRFRSILVWRIGLLKLGSNAARRAPTSLNL